MNTAHYKAAEGFDARRAKLDRPDMFQRFSVPDRGVPLAQQGMDDDELLMIVERGGARIALSTTQMNYHHLAQGKLAGQPYLVSY